MSIRVLDDKLAAAPETQARGLVRALVAGAGLSGGMIAAMTPEWGLDVVDHDAAGSAQTIVPTLARPGVNKAVLALDYRRERIPWAPGGLAVAAEAQALGDGYFMHLARAGGVIIACTDCVATQTWLAATAARHGLGLIATGLGPREVEALVSPPGEPSFCCLGRRTDAPRMPCLLRDLPVEPLNDPPAPPTNSSLHLAALAAAVAVEEAWALCAGERTEAQIISCVPGQDTVRARIPRRAGCSTCAPPPGAPEEIVPLDLAGSSRFADILRAVGGQTGWMIHVPRAAHAIICASCDTVHELDHFAVVGRRMRCSECAGGDLAAVGEVSQGAWVDVEGLADHAPLEMGWPYWPVLRLRRDDSDLLVELAADARDEGVIAVEPLLIGGEHHAT